MIPCKDGLKSYGESSGACFDLWQCQNDPWPLHLLDIPLVPYAELRLSLMPYWFDNLPSLLSTGFEVYICSQTTN
ncbi:unnamed protein product [Coffea canephora]|uniref:Uncharacterized protein n=1 Tax=Coffea canephora TaxID=49390 RepID=A0A068TZJ6_COFCA|nr:unnamed protein product [Coffea canephora]